VGAGPGDPSLITVKGLECLRQADVIVHDYLVNPRLLGQARDEAEIIFVGKRHDLHILSQDQINEILLRKAREGKKVVRLKGGDPFLFGRGAEEAQFLAENNISFEIVPGVSSAQAVPAYAGIPLTHRCYASDVTFVTGHKQDLDESKINWQKLGQPSGTLVFLMPVTNLENISKNLIRNGYPPSTSAALIRWGTTSEQETVIGKLGNIAELAKEKQIHPPAVLVVGEVVDLREIISWYEKKPLFGQRILVTRAKGQSASFISALERFGAEAIEFPTIKITPVDDYSIFDKAVSEIDSFRWLVFTSVNGVNYFVKRLNQLSVDIRDFKGIKIAAIGTATAKAVEGLNLKIDLLPKEFKAEGLINSFRQQGISNQRILIPRALEAREILPETLRKLGADVVVAPVYKTVLADPPVKQIKTKMEAKKVSMITFTSSSTVRNFVKLISGNLELRQLMKGIKVAVIGPITAKTAEELGLKVDIMAETYTTSGLLKAILEEASRVKT
jgi:uroporphyrinogen III methyltransferase/synthase